MLLVTGVFDVNIVREGDEDDDLVLELDVERVLVPDALDDLLGIAELVYVFDEIDVREYVGDDVVVFEFFIDDVAVVDAVFVLEAFIVPVVVRVPTIVFVALLVFEFDDEEDDDLDARVELDWVGLELDDLEALKLKDDVGELLVVLVFDEDDVSVFDTIYDKLLRDDDDAVLDNAADCVDAGLEDAVLDVVPDLVDVMVCVFVLVEVEEGVPNLLGNDVLLEVTVLVLVLDAVDVGESGKLFAKSPRESTDIFSVGLNASEPMANNRRYQGILYYCIV